VIISASRRTDLPAFYMPWFLGRLAAGRLRTVNPFNSHQQRVVSFAPEYVDAIVFWTRDPQLLAEALPRIEALGYARTVALVTLTGLPRILEPDNPSLSRVLEGLDRLAAHYGDVRRISWRFDPVVEGPGGTLDDHLERFAYLAGQLEGLTKRVIVSFIDLYRKTRRRLARVDGVVQPAAPDRGRRGCFLARLRDLAHERGMTLELCAEPENYAALGVPAGCCIDPRQLAEIFPLRAPCPGKDRGQRPACGCAPSVDVGMPDSCLHGCVYCYAARSHAGAVARHARHDPAGESLLPVKPTLATISLGRRC